MTTIRIISFPNQEGQMLHGILHEPDAGSARGVCVLLLSPGIKGRVGPHRLYLKIAARLAPLGFHVLRFDFYGLGDSEGELPERFLADMYNSIQAGRYVGDTIAAMDWMQNSFGIRRFVGSGLCGGSISALEAAAVDRRIGCLLGIGLPTVLEGGPENWLRILTQHQIASMRGSYIEKVRDPRSWLRFVAGKSSYRVMWRVIKDWPLRRLKRRGHRAAEVKAEADSTNPLFASAFMAMLDTGRPMILFFAGADRLRYQFAENFESHNESRIRGLRHLYEVHLIPDANHVFSDAIWMAEFLEAAERWLNVRYPSR